MMLYLIESIHPDGWTGYLLDKNTKGSNGLPIPLVLPYEEATQKAQELAVKFGEGYLVRIVPVEFLPEQK